MKANGIYRLSELEALYDGRGRLAKDLRRGKLRRIAHGWYASREAAPDLVRVLAAGARPACVSALKKYGLFSPPHAGLHVVTLRGTRLLTPRQDFVLHPHPYLRTWPDDEPIIRLMGHVVGTRR